jgi:hypothetical protein
MKLRIFVLTVAIVLTVGPFAVAQPEPPHVAEMHFVNELRKRGDVALALDYLQRLGKNPSPELAKELPFEIAKTRLAIGTEESESSKRLALYQQARNEFEAFLAKNPDSPRAGEARLEIAQVAVLQGKTQLSKALTQDSVAARASEALVARRLLEDAGKQLTAAAADIEAQLKKVPDTDKARRRKLETDLLRANLSRALNRFDQAQTFIDTGNNAVLRERGDKVDEAAAALEKIANSDNGSIGWQATAWLGRCQQLLGRPNDARKSLTKLLTLSPTPANADARRLAQYFLMLLTKESPDASERDPVGANIAAARKWLKDYPRQHNSPEGYGVRFLLAENLVALTERATKTTPENVKAAALHEARDLLKDIEHSENDFTDRARRMKIVLIDKQGGFRVPVEQLKTFDDCYIRSQYEMFMIAEDIKDAKDEKEREAKIAKRRDTARKALELGLSKPDAKANAQGKYSYEVNNARMILAYNYLQSKLLKEAIQTAETLARNDIRASQAQLAAAYAMQAYAEYLAEREQKVASKEDLKPERDKMLAFAKFAEEAWPDELPANLARHQVGLMLLRDKQLGEAIKKLNTVTPTYPNYANVKYLIAEVCQAAEKEKREPLKEPGLGSYADIAMKALLSIPDSSLGSPDPTVNHVYFLSRISLAQQYFKEKKYVEMEKLAAPLIDKVATVRLAVEDDRNSLLQRDIKASLQTDVLYGKFGLADLEYKEKHYAKVLEMLGPIVAEINEDKQPQLKNNPPLSNALLSMALKATMELNDLEKTKAVLTAMQKVGGEGDGGSTNILLQLVELIQTHLDALQKKSDADALAKTKKAFQQILNEVDRGQKNKSPEFAYLLAKNYSSIDEHEKAANILEAVKPPQPTGMKEADERNERLYHTVRVAYIHELRLSGDKERAAKLLEESMGTPKQPGWGMSHVEAQLERVLMLEEDNKYATAARLADEWVRKLKSKAEADGQVREKYLEFYYHTAYSFFKYGQTMKEKDKAKGEKAIKDAASQLVQLEKTWKGFGSETSTKRIQELFDKEPDLKTQFETLKNK